MQTPLYPLKFIPILKPKIWGGEKLHQQLNKPTTLKNIGESWEISDVENTVSIVANGALQGTNLQELLNQYTSDLVGKKNHKTFGNTFPLLLKFIDAKKDLSIQLHPNDTLAKKRHNSFGKTEMWYVMQADEAANLIVGFNQKINKEKYLHHLKNNTLTSILNFDTVQEGDTYFIEAGRIHAIGAGVLLAEIQQTSDITYRVYDWDRKDKAGNTRELHNDIALDAFNFNMKNNFRVAYSKEKNQSNTMVKCSYFTTNFIALSTTLSKKNAVDSFIIYMCISGEAKLTTKITSITLQKGETVLLPACISSYTLEATTAKLLEIYV